MNNKLLSVVLVAWIATTWFASMSSANDSTTESISEKIKSGFERIQLTDEQKAERKAAKEAIAPIFEKKKAGTELSETEQTQLDTFKSQYKGGKKGKRGGKRGMKNLTDEEKTALEAMSDEDKKAFFEAKKEERTAQKEAKKAVMDKILNWTTLSSIEEATRLEIVAKMAEKEANSEWKKRGGNNESVWIMKKLVNLETLTDEEKTTLTEMKAKREQRQAAKEAIAPILEKKKAGTELSETEQTQLDTFKAEHKGKKKGHWKRGGKKGNR